MIALARALIAPVAYLLAALWVWRARVADEHRKRQRTIQYARIHLDDGPRLRTWLTDGPLPTPAIQATCAQCNAGPMDPCDAGLHS